MRGALALMGMLLAACGAAPSENGAAATPSLQLGNAAPDVKHQPLGNGSAVTVVHGPQGGYHVWLSIHASGVALPSNAQALVLRWKESSPSESLGSGRIYLPLDELHNGTLEHTGMIMLLDPRVMPMAWTAEALHVEAALVLEDNTVLMEQTADWSAGCCIETSTRDAGP